MAHHRYRLNIKCKHTNAKLSSIEGKKNINPQQGKNYLLHKFTQFLMALKIIVFSTNKLTHPLEQQQKKYLL